MKRKLLLFLDFYGESRIDPVNYFFYSRDKNKKQARYNSLEGITEDFTYHPEANDRIIIELECKTTKKNTK